MIDPLWKRESPAPPLPERVCSPGTQDQPGQSPGGEQPTESSDRPLCHSHSHSHTETLCDQEQDRVALSGQGPAGAVPSDQRNSTTAPQPDRPDSRLPTGRPFKSNADCSLGATKKNCQICRLRGIKRPLREAQKIVRKHSVTGSACGENGFKPRPKHRSAGGPILL